MNLEAKQRLQSFELLPRGVAPDPRFIRARGDLLNRKGRLEFIHGASNDPDITVGFHKTHDELTYYIFVLGKCQGNVMFDFEQGAKLKQKAALDVTLAAVPHTVLDKSIRGKGIVSFLYRQALDKNLTLITDMQTEMAAVIWDSVARNPHYHLYQVENGQVVNEETLTSFKVLTRKKL